jgi:hypothetical protein
VAHRERDDAEHWQRRERKLRRRRRGMRVTGAGVKTLLRVIQRKAEQAERAAKERSSQRKSS